MKTVTRTYEVYAIAELTAEALEKAYTNWLENYDYAWTYENKTTLEAFCAIFGVECHHWSYDAYNYSFRFSIHHSDNVEELKGQRLATYIVNNFWSALFPAKSFWKHGRSRKSRISTDCSCPLTGYYIDDEILHPVYDFIAKPQSETTFETLIDSCLERFFSSCRDDVAYGQGKENFKEENELNEWEYLSDGQLFN